MVFFFIGHWVHSLCWSIILSSLHCSVVGAPKAGARGGTLTTTPPRGQWKQLLPRLRSLVCSSVWCSTAGRTTASTSKKESPPTAPDTLPRRQLKLFKSSASNESMFVQSSNARMSHPGLAHKHTLRLQQTVPAHSLDTVLRSRQLTVQQKVENTMNIVTSVTYVTRA